MELATFQYDMVQGWSIKSFPDMDSDQTLILIFAAPEYLENLSPIKDLAHRYPKSKIIGCSSAGEIFGPSILDESISVAILRFEKTRIKTVIEVVEDPGKSFIAGEKIAEKLNAADLHGIFVLSNGLEINGSQLVNGLNSIIDEKVVITGGLAGDGKRFQKTWTVYDGKVYKNHVAAVGFYGKQIHMGHASRGGWDIFGPERRITHSENNILYELDGKPALALYKEYLGERASALPATGLLYPLAIRKNQADSKHIVRTILGIDEKKQSLIFAGDMPIGYLSRLMRANFDRLINSASEAGEAINDVISKNPPKPIFSTVISCVGRRLLLGERTEEETEAVLESLPKGTKQIGFYSYGEISPYYKSGSSDLHNQTMTVTTFSEL